MRLFSTFLFACSQAGLGDENQKTCEEKLREMSDDIINGDIDGYGRVQCDDGRYVKRYSCKERSQNENWIGGELFSIYTRWGSPEDQPCLKLCAYRDVDKLFPLKNGTWKCNWGPKNRRRGHNMNKHVRECRAKCDVMQKGQPRYWLQCKGNG